MTDWVIIDALTKELRCRHCGETHALGLPKTIRRFVKEARAFDCLHSDCPDPKAKKVK